MKRHAALLSFIFTYILSIAQNPCAPIGADRCVNAPLINSCQLDGWTGNTDPPDRDYFWNGDVPQIGWCDNDYFIHNNQWLKFIADEDHLFIDVDVSACAQDNGIQMACYEIGDGNNCPGEQITCVGDGGTTLFVFEIDNLIPGNEYLLMIDGSYGDGCEFTLNIPSGIPIEVEVDALTLPICPGVPVQGALFGEITLGGGSNIIDGWSTENGNIVSGHFTNNPVIDQPGDYTYFAYNVVTCCFSTKTVTVEEITEFPLAQASVIKHIDCNDMTATLSAAGSEVDNGPNMFEYLWSFPNGNPAGEGYELEGLIYPGTYVLTVRNTSTGCESQVEVVVLEDYTEPEISLLAPPVINCQNPNPFLSLDAPTGSTFEWTSDVAGFSSNEQAPEVSEAGTYEVVVTGANGCTSDMAVGVTEDFEAPLLQVLAPTLDCTQPSAPINVINSNEETTYAWNGDNFSSTEQSPIISAPGTYFLVATNPNGCDQDYIVQVAQDISPPEIEIEPTEILDCNLTEFTLASTSPNILETYAWTGPNGFSSNEENPLITEPGNYSLEVMDDKGCSNITSIQVENNLDEPVAVLIVNDILTCSVLEVQIESQSDQEIVAYEWSDNLGSDSVASTSAIGTYFVTVTGTNGCTSVQSIEVSDNYLEPIPDAGLDATITCTQNQATLQGSGNSLTGGSLSYAWTLNGNVIGNTASLSVSATGSYQLIVTDLENGCTAIDEVAVLADENIPEIIVSDIATLNCATPQVLLSGLNSTSGPDISYQWLDNNQNIISNEANADVNTAGEYTFIVTNNANGCQSELPIQVIADFEAPEPTVSNIEILNCEETSFTVNANGLNPNLNNITYQWYDVGTNNLIGETNFLDINNPGDYNLIATNIENGCISEFPFQVLEDLSTPVADSGIPFTITCIETEALLDASNSQGDNLSYQWFNPDGSLYAEEQTTRTEVPGRYLLIVTNTESGCTSEASVDIDINADFPSILVNPTTVLTCTQPTTGLDAINSNNGIGNLAFSWFDENQNLISNEAVHEVSSIGVYTVEVLDLDSDCASTFSIEVFEDFDIPVVDAGPDQIITCDINTVLLDGSNSSSGSDFYYQWRNSNNVLLGNDEIVEVENPDTYTLIVSSISNGCSATSTVVVTPDENIPLVEVASDGTLSCLQDQVNLFSTLAVDPDYTYSWQNENGDVISETTDFTVNDAGVYTLNVINNTNGCSNSTSILVEDNFNQPDLTTSLPEVINCNNAEVSLQSSLADPDQDVSYSWSTLSQGVLGNEASITVDATGTYTLTATDNSSGCSQSIEILVTDDFEIIEPNPEVSNIIDCMQSSANLDVVNISAPNYTYTWYNAQGDIVSEVQNFSADNSGTYTVIATNNENGCTAMEEILVAENIDIPQLSIPAPEVLNCQILNTALLGQGNPDFSFQWMDSQGNILSNTLDLMVSEPGTYQLSVLNTENGCTNMETIEVLQNINFPEALIDDLAPLGLSCTQQSVTLDGSNSTPIGNVEFAWYDQNGNLVSTNPVYEATDPGQYQLHITDLNTFCVHESITAVTQNEDVPQANINPPAILNCNTSTITLDASQSETGSEFIYSWDIPVGATGFNDDDILQPQISTPGVYTIYVLNTNTGCENQFEVEVLADFTEPIAMANAEDELDCVTSEIQLNSIGSSSGPQFTNSWIIDGVSFTNLDFVRVQNPGDYTLIVVDNNNGCTTESIVTVRENTERPTAAKLAGEDITCFGFNDGFFQINEVIGGTPPYLFTIDESDYDQLPSIENLSPGSYPIRITDAIGCTLDTIIQIQEPPQVYVDLGDDITINLGETAYLNANSNVETIDWYTEDSLDCTQNCFNQAVSPYSTTLYEVAVMDANGCAAVSDIVVRIQFDRGVYIPNAFSPNNDGINDFFRVFGNSSVERVQYMLIADRWGEIVYEAEDIQLEEEQRFWDGTHRKEKMNNDIHVYFVIVEYIDGRIEEFKGDVTLMR